MSTPVDPQDNVEPGQSLTGAADRVPEVGADRPSGDSPSTARWADAEVSDGSSAHHGTTQMPPVHAGTAGEAGPGERRPQVEFRDSAPTLETPRPAVDQYPPGPDPRELGPDHLDRLAVTDPDLRAQPMAVGTAPDRQTVVAREKERFGGMKFGAAFFGWLTATGLAVLLLAILAAAGVAFGVATVDNVDNAVAQSQNATGTAKTVGLVGAIVLLVILFVAYYCGGYVAGRMARFDGVKQGLGVWLWAIITSAVIAAIAAIAGAKYNVLAQLNLPRIPVNEGSVTTVGVIAIAAAIVVALLGALLGGAIGTRYHRKVDAVGFEDTAR